MPTFTLAESQQSLRLLNSAPSYLSRLAFIQTYLMQYFHLYIFFSTVISSCYLSAILTLGSFETLQIIFCWVSLEVLSIGCCYFCQANISVSRELTPDYLITRLLRFHSLYWLYLAGQCCTHYKTNFIVLARVPILAYYYSNWISILHLF